MAAANLFTSLVGQDTCSPACEVSTTPATMPLKESGFKKMRDQLTDAEKRKKKEAAGKQGQGKSQVGGGGEREE